MTTMTPETLERIRNAVATYDDLTTRWYDTAAEMEATYPAAKEALRTIKDAVPGLLAHIDALTAENAALREDGRLMRRNLEMIANDDGEVPEFLIASAQTTLALIDGLPFDDDDAMPEIDLSDYVDCPCGCNEGYLPSGGECGCCGGDGAVHKDVAAAIEAEGGDDE